MSEISYAFSNAWELAERRLELLELEQDPITIRRAVSAGAREGWTCLEVGAGRGSIARWLCDVVGASGHVVAVDIDARFLRQIPATNLEVREQDVVAGALPDGPFDFIHARLLLMHLRERNALLERLVHVLAPGGVILCEEQDVFPIIGAAEGHYRDAWLAFATAMEASGVAPAWVRTLPARLEQLGVADIRTDVDVPFFRGGSRWARFWQLTWLQAIDRLVAAGVPRAIVENGISLLDDPTVWFHGPAMVAVSARRSRQVRRLRP